MALDTAFEKNFRRMLVMLRRRVHVRHGLWLWVERLEEGCLCLLKVSTMPNLITDPATYSELNLGLCGSSHELCWFSFYASRTHELRANATSI